MDQVCFIPITLCQKMFALLAERLGGEPKSLAGHP